MMHGPINIRHISVFTSVSANHTNEIREIFNLNITAYLNASAYGIRNFYLRQQIM
jgi:hypothetical protein